MIKTNDLPSQVRLKELFHYHPETGEFYWKTGRYSGKLAGTIRKGYTLINLSGKKLLAHRLAWVYMHGVDPAGVMIDHIDGIGCNNRIENLRLASRVQNNANCDIYKGYSLDRGKYKAQIMIDGKNVYLGRFDCPLLARLAYQQKHAEVHGNYSPYKKELSYA